MGVAALLTVPMSCVAHRLSDGVRSQLSSGRLSAAVLGAPYGGTPDVLTTYGSVCGACVLLTRATAAHLRVVHGVCSWDGVPRWDATYAASLYASAPGSQARRASPMCAVLRWKNVLQASHA